jgi:hypothetical protein
MLSINFFVFPISLLIKFHMVFGLFIADATPCSPFVISQKIEFFNNNNNKEKRTIWMVTEINLCE